jgi:hypothetical protein
MGYRIAVLLLIVSLRRTRHHGGTPVRAIRRWRHRDGTRHAPLVFAAGPRLERAYRSTQALVLYQPVARRCAWSRPFSAARRSANAVTPFRVSADNGSS